MKGNEKIMEHLNLRLTEELTWAIDEMKHAEKLIARISFLEGQVVSNLNKMHIGDEVPKMHKNDHMTEIDAIRGYNESIFLTRELGDNGSRELF